jgi:monoterpene epsilon-lactone hydrolase
MTQVDRAVHPSTSRRSNRYFYALVFFVVFASTSPIFAQETTARTAVSSDTTYIAPDGTAHITRIVPVPKTVSPEAQKAIAAPHSDAPVNQTLAEHRADTDSNHARMAKETRAVYPVDVTPGTIAGIPVQIITPVGGVPAGKADRVLINLHGGAWNSDSGSLTESIPIANLTQSKVITVLYRLAPEHPFPAGLDDIITVYKELLKTYKPQKIVIFGTSAGAFLTGEAAVRIKTLGLPLPAALGIFSGGGDYSMPADSQSLYTVSGLGGHLDPPSPGTQWPYYVGSTNPRDPVLSPVYADLHGLPPTLFVTSTRDLLLSNTSILHLAFLRAGVDARLIVYDGLNHAFWYNPNLPESKEVDGFMARFFEEQLDK